MKTLGYANKIKELIPSEINEAELGRIIVEHKERYILQSTEGTFNAEITGNLRFTAESRADFPAVGDWVRFIRMDEQNAVILEIFPRFSMLERQAVGKHGEIQIIATNIDYAFIVQAVGHDFNLKRLERYLTICHSAKIKPILILTKIDLIPVNEVENLIHQISERIKNVPLIALSNKTKVGYKQLNELMEASKTYCFIGSSGVGKSTIVNHLKDEQVLETNEISSSTNKGKHTTSHRELFVLPNKSIVIDTPGMREVGITDQSQGIELTYDQINELANQCRFSNCMHINEADCAVLEALENGELSEEVYENYQKLKREQEHFSSTVLEKRQRDKEFGKMIKAVQNERKRFRF
ncbi:ribosome small subunit-dependent GTPase A [Draconibacterium sp.]|nr:ribosome small subunit-dependent GTPase A [Draconibacterium sp.]